MSQKRFTGAKLAIFGSAGVGKTAFAVRYITKRFIGDYDSDREMMYTHKMATGKEEVLEILDTASDPSPEVTEKHVRWADGFVLLYSVTDHGSLTHLAAVIDAIDRLKGHECPLVLVGNKTDLAEARQVTEEEAVEVAARLDCPKFEISVAEGSQGVGEVMDELMCLLKRDFVKGQSAAGGDRGVDNKPKSKLFSMKKAFKKRINRSHSDTF